MVHEDRVAGAPPELSSGARRKPVTTAYSSKANWIARPSVTVVLRYGSALISVGAAVIVTAVWLHFDSPLPFTGFALSAIAIAFWYGGTSPGILAVLLATLARSYFWQPSNTTAQRILYDSVFLVFALVMMWLTRIRNELEVKVAERTQELSTANEKLENEILQRKRAETQSRVLIDAIPQQIWSGPPDGTLDYCNDRWRSYMGMGLEELRGDGWQSMLHPDDRARVLNAWHESVAHGTPYEQEERHRGADGTYRWFLARGVPLRDGEGGVVRWYGTNTDIEDRKRAEEDGRRLSGQLLRSQDEERRRIARDLHDDLGQDLFAANLALGQLARTIPDERPRESLSDAQEMIRACAEKVRTIAHLLHPPELELLGLRTALLAYVEGFRERSGIQVDLEVPAELPKLTRAIESALLKMAQECLLNTQRHSKSLKAQMRIEIDSNQIALDMRDDGIGTQPAKSNLAEGIQPRLGVGLAGMTERMKELGGRLEITSGSWGTSVKATLPLGSSKLETES
jgi:PAS domain S-box-containing protein